MGFVMGITDPHHSSVTEIGSACQCGGSKEPVAVMGEDTFGMMNPVSVGIDFFLHPCH